MKVQTCPACGFTPEVKSGIEEAEGQLVELTKHRAKVDKREKQRWYSGFLTVARERGYRSGWAANQYRQKFGAWPRGLDRVPAPAGQDVRNYVTASQIRYAKRRKAQEAAHA